ncbi:MAG: AsmA family protein [Phycisphaerae bacterium]
MAEPTDKPVAASKDSGAETKPRKRKHRLRRALLVILVILVLLVVFLPWLLSTGPLRRMIVSAVNDRIAGKLDIADWSLSWFGICSLDGVGVTDPKGRKALSVQRVQLDRGLLKLLTSREDLGQLTVTSPDADIVLLNDGGNSIAEAFAPKVPAPAQAPQEPTKAKGPAEEVKTALAVSVTGGKVHLAREDGREYSVSDLNLQFKMKTLNDLSATLSGVLTGGSKLSLNANIRNASVAGKPFLDTVEGQVAAKTVPAVDLKPLIAFLTEGVQGTGTAAIDVDAKFAPGAHSGTWSVKLTGLSANAQDSKVTVTPTDLTLSGTLATKDGKFQADTSLDGKIATLQSDFVYALGAEARPVATDAIIDALMDGRSVPLPDFSLKADGKVDLAAAGLCIPGLLKLRKDVQITAGTIDMPDVQVRGGDKPSAQADLKARVTILKGNVTKELDPIEATLKVAPEADGKLRLQKADLKWTVVTANASGTIDQLDATVKADLDAAKKEFNELFDLQKQIISGNVTAVFKVVKKDPSAKKLDLSLTVDADKVRYGAIPEPSSQPAPAPTTAKADKGPAVITAQATWQAALEQAAPKLSLAGTLTVAKLTTAEYGDVLNGEQPVVEHKITLDTKQERLDLSKFAVVSKLLMLNLAGDITELDTDQILDLSGNYSASWSDILALVKKLAPSAVESIAMADKSAGDIRIRGPAGKPEITGLGGNTTVGWGQNSQIYGLVLSQAKIEPTLKDGQINMPLAAIPANEGTLRLAGNVDLRGKEPQLKIPGKLEMMENVSLNAELGKMILSRALPLLAQTNKLEGKVSLTLYDIDLPLGADLLKSGKGSGRLDLSNIRLAPAGETAKLFQLIGIPAGQPYPIRISPVDFVLKDGGLTYDNLTLTFGDNFDVKFRGSVMFDDTINLVMSLPVKANLLEGLGVKGPVGDYARVLEGTRIDIPLMGTRTNPMMDLSKVNVQGLVSEAIKKLGAGIIPGIPKLPGLTPGASPTTQPKGPIPGLPGLPLPKL